MAGKFNDRMIGIVVAAYCDIHRKNVIRGIDTRNKKKDTDKPEKKPKIILY